MDGRHIATNLAITPAYYLRIVPLSIVPRHPPHVRHGRAEIVLRMWN
jgi:hypothetical protein